MCNTTALSSDSASDKFGKFAIAEKKERQKNKFVRNKGENFTGELNEKKSAFV